MLFIITMPFAGMFERFSYHRVYSLKIQHALTQVFHQLATSTLLIPSPQALNVTRFGLFRHSWSSRRELA